MLWRCDVVIVVVAPACVVANQSNACVFLTHANITKAHPSARELIVKVQRKNKESPLKRMFVDFVCLLKPLTTKTKTESKWFAKIRLTVNISMGVCVWIHGKHCERVRMGRILTSNDKRTKNWHIGLLQSDWLPWSHAYFFYLYFKSYHFRKVNGDRNAFNSLPKEVLPLDANSS